MVSGEKFEPDTAPVQAACSNHYAMVTLERHAPPTTPCSPYYTMLPLW